MKKTFLKSLFFMSMAVCLFSCKDDNSPLDEGNTPQGVNVTFDYSQAKLSRSAGSTATLNGTSDVAWKIEIEDGEFFSVEPMEGAAGEFTLTVKAEKDNTSTDKQYSKFIFNAAGRKYPITVIHLEDDIRLEVSYEAETVFEFDKDGVLASPDLTAKPFTATSNTEWTVKTVSETDTWIKVGPEVGEIGENLPISLEVEANPYAEVRTGKFEVRVPESMSFSYTVSQEAADLVYSIKDGDTELTVDNGFKGLAGGGDSKTITLNANAGWKIEAADNSQWLKFEPSEGVASLENVSITMTVEPNDDKYNSREGEFTITFKDGGSTSITIKAEQNKGEMPEEVSKLKELEIAFEGEGNDVLNWSSESDYTKWTGVKFEGGKLTELELSGKELKGYIPEGIKNFTSLRVLDLSNNELTATPNLSKITVDKSVSGASLSKDASNTPIDQSYTPAIPVEIKNLKNLTTFKISGNKIEGTFPSDVVNNPNYLQWKAMENIFPQNDVYYSAISYSADSEKRYDAAAPNADPSKWKFKLTQIGILRVMYYAMGGVNWNTTGEPEWLNEEFIIAQSWDAAQNKTVYPCGTENPKFAAVGQIGGNQDVQKFEVGNVGGYIPEECLMNSGLAHLWVDGTNGFKLTGSIHPLIMQRLNYMCFNNHDLDMNVNFIFANLRNSVANIKFQNNANIDGNTDFTLLNTYATGKKVGKAAFTFAGTGITGSVKVSAITCFNTTGNVLTVDEWKTKVPATVIVSE